MGKHDKRSSRCSSKCSTKSSKSSKSSKKCCDKYPNVVGTWCSKHKDAFPKGYPIFGYGRGKIETKIVIEKQHNNLLWGTYYWRAVDGCEWNKEVFTGTFNSSSDFWLNGYPTDGKQGDLYQGKFINCQCLGITYLGVGKGITSYSKFSRQKSLPESS